MKYFLTFAIVATMCMGCVVGYYPIVKETNGFAGPFEPTANLGLKNSFLWQSAEVITLWPDMNVELFSFMDQDVEGNALITSYGNQLPPGATYFRGFQPYFGQWAVCDKYMGTELQGGRNKGGLCPAWYSKAPYNRRLEFPPQPGDTQFGMWYTSNNNCPQVQATVSLIVGYAGRIMECGGRYKGIQAGGLSPYDKVEILNELAVHGTLVDGMYNYTLKGEDLNVRLVQPETDQSWHLDLAGMSAPIQISETVTGVAYSPTQIVGVHELLDQVADISDAVDGNSLVMTVSWKTITKSWTVALRPGDFYRTVLTPQTFSPVLTQ